MTKKKPVTPPAKSSRSAKRKAKPQAMGNVPSSEALRRFVRTHADDFLKDPNVTSIGVAEVDGKPCIQFTVATKLAPEALESARTRMLPSEIEIDGQRVPTDVVQRRYSMSYRVVGRAETEKDPRKVRVDPIVPGVSISHPSGTAGTLGAIVYDRATGAACVLSNWHVLHTPQGAIGDEVVQPGPFDDNNSAGNGAGTLLRSHLGPAGDCAIALVGGRDIEPQVLGLDVVPGRIGEPEIGDKVVKSGRTTAVTRGEVRRIHVVTKIDYGPPIGTRNIGGFEIGPQVGASTDYEVSMGGDSGSLWLAEDRDGKATDVVLGLHFAGETEGQDDEHAVACYSQSVFEKLEIQLQPPAAPEAVTGGAGYNREFLGTTVAAPKLNEASKDDLVRFGQRLLIPYTHFSVCLSRSRGLAHFVAWNIDGEQLKAFGRKGLTFKKDPRIPEEYQIGDELYADNKLDRGHIARRADLVWGSKSEATQANKDSFYFTNITPQHQAFNQSARGGLWGELENAIFEEANALRTRLSVFSGPIFTGRDPKYREVKVPKSFWKLIAWVDAETEKLQVKAYVLSQKDLLNDIEAFDLDAFRLYQLSVHELEKMLTVAFSSAIAKADTFVGTETLGTRRAVREVTSRAEIF
jgi:endonuclease G, mitochondrial